MKLMRLKTGLFFSVLSFSWLWAQPKLPDVRPESVVMTLDEAIQIGLVNNLNLKVASMSLSEVNNQVEEGYSNLYPKVNLSSSYQRNVVSANPFAGSSAGSLFSGLGQVGWLSYNEQARTDGDPATNPITLSDYYAKVSAGQAAAGISSNSSSNPFGVENNFNNAIAISQTLYNAAAIQGIRATEVAQSLTSATVLRAQQQVVSQIRAAYYRVMLAREQVRVITNSMERLRETVRDVGKTVQQGVAPRYQRLSAEVELGNLETQLYSAQNNAELALSSLKLLVGLPAEQKIDLRATWDDLRADGASTDALSQTEAIGVAIKQRPDLVQAQKNIELQHIQRGLTQSMGRPILSAFGNFAYNGRVPSNRSYAQQDANDPFKFTKERNGYFSDGYWDPSVVVGLTLSWSLYDGGARRFQMRRNDLAIERAEWQKLQAIEGIKLEVEQAMRSLGSAKQRIMSQEANIGRAEENYRIASTRLKEGVGNQLEERQASELLDQSRLAYAAALFDYLIARNAVDTAIGSLPHVAQEVALSTGAFKTNGIWKYVNRIYGLK